MRKIQSLRKLLPLVGGGNRSVFLRIALFVVMLVSAQAGWAETTIKTIDFTQWTAQSNIADGTVINDCYFKGAGASISSSNGLHIGNNMKVNNYYVSIPLTGINGSISVTIEGSNRPTYKYAISSNQSTIAKTIDLARPASGTTVSFTENVSSKTAYLCIGVGSTSSDIKTITVTTPDASTDATQSIPVADLRFEHQTYNPSRHGVAGFDITTTGWQSYTTVSGDTRMYTLLLSNTSTNSITISPNAANSGRKIKQVVLYGAYGANTFNNATVTSANTRKYSDATSNVGTLVWEDASGAESATISISSTDRPHIFQIAVVTDAAMTKEVQNVDLSFDPSSGTTTANQTDFSINSRVKASIGDGDTEYFRVDGFTVSNASGSNASFNQFHLSTGFVGVNTGSSNGTATITTTCADNDFYHITTQGTYSLTISGGTTTKSVAFTVDDMRISKESSPNGLSASEPTTGEPNGMGFDRQMGGFNLDFAGGDGTKFNNNNFIIFREKDTYNGQVTITPIISGTGTVNITRVDITTLASYTDGTVSINNDETPIQLTNVSTYSFTGSYDESFTMKALTGDIYVTGFTIYYEDDNNVLNTAKVTPTFTFKRDSQTVTSPETVSDASTYTSPDITATPANYAFDINSDNISVANVGATSGASSGLIALQGGLGTANIKVTAAGESDFFTAFSPVTYTVIVNNTTAKKWDFTTLDVTNTITNDTGWSGAAGWSKSGDYYNNVFTTSTNFSTANEYSAYDPTSTQLKGLKFARFDNSGLKSGALRLHTTYLTYNNSNVIIGIPVKAGQSVNITFSDGTYKFDNAQVDGNPSATTVTAASSETRTVTLKAIADGYVNLYNSSGKPHLYLIEVTDETRGTLTLTDGTNTYEQNHGTSFTHSVRYAASDGRENPINYADDHSLFTITSSDSNVLNVNGATVSDTNFGSGSSFQISGIVPGNAGTATLTINFAGNNEYKPYTYTSQTYTVNGPVASFKVVAADQDIQQGQFSEFTPIITNAAGERIGIKEMTGGSYTTYVLDEEENAPDYTNYFDFTYTPATTGTGSNWQYIVVDANGHITTEQTEGGNTVLASVGDTRKVTITATPKSAYESAFTNGINTTATVTPTLTIIEKVKEPQFDLYWDAACTVKFTGMENDKWIINANQAKQDDDKLWNFKAEGTEYAAGFPNGRMFYVKPKNEGDAIFFSYKQDGSANTIPANPSLDVSKGIYQYRRGIPVYVDDDFVSGTSYVTVNIVAATYDGSTKKYSLNGSVARMRFDLITHARPAEPTYEPTSPDSDPTLNNNGRKIMNTAQNVVAYGEGASSSNPDGSPNLVYGKFSTGSVYTTEQLVNEANVQLRVSNVPVISTEVNKRRFTSVQIKVESEGYEYISEQTYTEYYYLYDTEMRLTPASYNINPNTAVVAENAPQVTVTWYNKKSGAKQEVDTYAGKISYAITGWSDGLTVGTDVSVDASTGIVTSSTNNQGWVKVTATYAGGEEHGDKTGEPQYKSTTDKSSADFYVYIYDPNSQRPTITPTSRNFTGKMTYTITAPSEWGVIYTNNGSEIIPASSTADETNLKTLAAGQQIDITIGEGMSVNQTHTVKAFAYIEEAGDTRQYSDLVVESYTLRASIPDPVFDPDGTDKDKDGTIEEGEYYKYNTNELTVTIACPYPGSEIYYTIDGSNPVIGAANTYKYSGLSKVTIEGNVTIKAVAYDPEYQIFSNTVPSSYVYSTEMLKPYFQISKDEGATWWGMSGSTLTQNATEWNSGQSYTVTPSTQIRLIDPNPVKGTIYYTVNGIDPTSDANSLVYFEGYPFTVGKTTTAKAITTLEDASSSVASAEFNIDATKYGNVWEAVDATLNAVTIDGEIKKGLDNENGFVISTVATLPVVNTGSKVNKRSISGESIQGFGSRTYAQPDITATFGGYDHNDWEEMVIADAAIGTPIDAVGTYNIRNSGKNGEKKDGKEINNGNAQDETLTNYNHAFMTRKDGRTDTAPATHDKTFTLPATGTFVRFEPEKDGDLTIWCLQQGSLLYEDDRYLIDNVIRLRPVYFLDEQGKSYQVKKVNGKEQMWSAARLSENWSKLVARNAAGGWMPSRRNDDGKMEGVDETYAQFLHLSDGALVRTRAELPSGSEVVDKLSDAPAPGSADYNKYYKRVYNKGTNAEESADIFSIIQADLDKNNIKPGDPLKPVAVHTGTEISQNDGSYIDTSDDGTGYALASGGYAKYTFEVKAGKTYYFLGVNTKIGIRGFQFVPAEDVSARKSVEIVKASSDVTVAGSSMTLGAAIEACEGKTVNVKLKDRNFTTNWTTLVLPFSVSVAQIEKVFGDKTDIIHFDDITADTNADKLNLKRHWYKMIVAGTPVLIKPTEAVNEPEFTGVQLETSEVDEIMPKTLQHYKMTGTLVKADGALLYRDYYVNSAGNITWLNATSSTVNSGYGWFKKIDNSVTARTLTLETIRSFTEDFVIDDRDDTTTDLRIAVYEDTGVNTFGTDDNIYNLNGVKMGSGASLQHLPKGIYIVNGKKIVIK